MDIELVTIGTELLLGFTVDTNSAFAGQALAARGVRVVRRTSVRDEPHAIRDAVREALARTGVVITTGGLGPTRDDISKKVVADLFDAPLEFNDGLWAAMVERYRRLGRVPVDSNRSQAEVPRGATILPNRWGSASGLWLEGKPGVAILLPGVPLEMRNLMEHEVVPRLAARTGNGSVIRSRSLRTAAIAEAVLAERLGEIESDIAPLTLAYLPDTTGVDLRLTAWDLAPADADRRLAAAAELIRARAGGHVFGEGNADLAAVLLEALRRSKVRLAVAESCTGGLVGGRITAIPGSSDVFLGATVAYANAVKTAQLDVAAELIERHGAVSEEVARAMARGARERFGAEAAVSVTGIAGPDGGSEAKPVGTVWFGVSVGDHEETVRYVFLGGREEIRARAAQMALYLLWRQVR
ncbi:MAG TPA: competence/damage-inducible protein A [Gemmatimonadales bacterium]|nr:competence/damage-inducible protein A [Gemmatimonadales bacterium]